MLRGGNKVELGGDRQGETVPPRRQPPRAQCSLESTSIAMLEAITSNTAATSIISGPKTEHRRRSSTALADEIRRLHRDGGRRRGYPDENALRQGFIRPAGFVRRNAQPRVEYCLSEIGESLRPVIDALREDEI